MGLYGLLIEENTLGTSLGYGLLGTLLAFCVYFGLHVFTLPPIWVDVAAVLLLSMIFLPMGPWITGNRAADALVKGLSAFFFAAVAIQGFLPFLFSFPQLLPKFVLTWLSLGFLIRIPLRGQRSSVGGYSRR